MKRKFRILRALLSVLMVVAMPLAVMADTGYPAALDGDDDLINTTNNAFSYLDGAIDATVTTIVVNNASSFPSTYGIIQIDNELIYYTSRSGTTFSGCTRSYDDTSAVSHSDDTLVEATIASAHHEYLKNAVIAVQAELGVDPAGAYATVVARLNAINADVSITTGQISDFDSATTALIEGYGYTTTADCTITSGQVSDFDSASTALIEGYGYTTNADVSITTGQVTDFDSASTALIEGYGYTTTTDCTITSGQVSDFDSAVTALVESYNYTTTTDCTITSGQVSDFDSAVTALLTNGNIPDTIDADAISVFGMTITSGAPSDNYILKYDAALTMIMWEADAAGGGSGSVTTIKEADSGVGDADIVTLDFDGDDFDLTESPDTEIQIVLTDQFLYNTGDTGTGVYDFGGTTSFEITNTSADVTCTAGQIAIDTAQHQFCVSDTTYEVAFPMVRTKQFTMDLASQYDLDPDVKLAEFNSTTYPNGIVIVSWSLAASVADPTTEPEIDLYYCDAIGTGAFPAANPVLVDVLDTTTGNSSESDMSNSDLGSGVIPTTKVLYLILQTDPTDANVSYFLTITYVIPES